MQLLAHHDSMEREEHHPNSDECSSHADDGPAQSASAEPGEKAKRTKHSRVHKRERELYGLVTPVFLPLLDAKDTSPKHERKQPKPHSQTTEDATPSRDADTSTAGRTPRREHTDMESSTAHGSSRDTTTTPNDPPKKPRHASTSTAKKSALRQTTSRNRRKRVSLVIDGQTVLPADTVAEPALISPSSEEATSTSNSTASLDDMIDPRLTSPHVDAMHHSLPLPMSNNIHSPTKPLVETTSNSLTTDYQPVLDPYHSTATTDSPLLDAPPNDEDDDPDSFNTYVGGLHGSGIDDVEQAGSYGYPSSLGASYLESYMQSRPLRVRMEAGLEGREKKVDAGKEKQKSVEKEKEKEKERRRVDEDEDMDFMGEMEGF